MLQIIVTLIFMFSHFNYTNSELVRFNKCGSSPAPLQVDLAKCGNPDLCTIYRNAPINFKLSLISPIDADQLQLAAWTSVWGIWIPIRPKPVSVCNIYGITCPVVKGKTYTYDIKVNVPWLPAVHTKVKFSLLSGKGETVSCLIMHIKVA